MKRPDTVTEKWLTIPACGRKMRLLIVSPREEDVSPRPGVLWIHGGGYLTGMARMVYMSRAIDLVVRGGAVVVSPAYSLSLHRPYPAALDECHAALVYMKDHADELGIRPDQIMVGGESAGGGLTAALCMVAKDRQTVNIAFQMPLYPMLDCFDTPSSRDNHAKIWNTRRNHIAWKLYLRGIRDKSQIPDYASPARRRDYTGLPPCYSFVGDIEPFHDETLAYIEHLRQAGVEAEVDVYKGFYHAYDMMKPKTEEARKAADVLVCRFLEACKSIRRPRAEEALPDFMKKKSC